MQATQLVGAHLAAAATIVNAIYRASITTPANQQRLDRRLFKFVEELGEVAEAYLDITGSNRKGKTAYDLLEEKVDLFIVSSDTVFQHGRLAHLNMETLRAGLTQALALAIATEGQRTWGGFSHEDGIREVATNLGRALSELHSDSNLLLPVSLAGLQQATAQLLLVPEATWSEKDGPREDWAYQMRHKRLDEMVALVATKVAKWETNRALPNAA